MSENDPGELYEAENSQKIVGELFRGKLTLEQALQRLRTRILDLSSRNRLLNYRHPKGRCIQFVDKPNLNLVFERLIDAEKIILIKHVPDPPTDSYERKRPDVRQHAMSLGIDTATEFDVSCCGPTHQKHTPKLQALFYPNELDRRCRRIGSEARMVIEETGTNMLHLIFGFLEFYEREDSEKPMFAPLLAVPASLERGAIDQETRSYQYSVLYSGEDIHENHTLREKLNQDLAFHLPEFGEEDTPGAYLEKISQATKNKKLWRVRYQLTLGFLSFGKLAIWNDLDPIRWPSLLNHPLLNELFSGSSDKGGSLFSEDYEIDKHPQANLPLIYDADSSQHSAIIDVLSGKNMVINGPPGTGKSQTITNIIAEALKEGKKILFVSEKLAALQVVRHRLNQAHLGHFCLELHSHKTKKKKLLGDIQERLDKLFQPPQQLEAKLSSLIRHKKELNRYVELMSSKIGNELDLSVHDIFWRAEHHRRAVGDLSNAVQSIFLPDTDKWSYDEIEGRRAKLEALGQMFETIGSFDSSHPWWGFFPKLLAPGDNEAIGRITSEALRLAKELSVLVNRYQSLVGDAMVLNLQTIEKIEKSVSAIPDPAQNLIGFLLEKFFSKNDPYGKKSRLILDYVSRQILQIRELIQKAELVLLMECTISIAQVMPIIQECIGKLIPEALLTNLPELRSNADKAVICLVAFKDIFSDVSTFRGPLQGSALEGLTNLIARITPLEVLDTTVGKLYSAAQAVSREVATLKNALEKIKHIADQGKLFFDGSPTAVAQMASGSIEDVVIPVPVDSSIIERVRQAAEYVLSDLPLAEIDSRQKRLQFILEQMGRSFEELKGFSDHLSLAFDGTPQSISCICALASVTKNCPTDLLSFRQASFENTGTAELIKKAEQAHQMEASLRADLDKLFYLDTLPDVAELKAAIQTFRRGDSFFNFLNAEWRSAKRLFVRLAKQKAKYKATEYADHIKRIVTWLEHRANFINNGVYKEHFGTLFKGIDTDFAKIRRLHTWYSESQAALIGYPGLIQNINLSAMDSSKLQQIAAQSTRLCELAEHLEQGKEGIEDTLGMSPLWLDELHKGGWPTYISKGQEVANKLHDIVQDLNRLVRSSVSPKRAIELLNVKLELQDASEELAALSRGMDVIAKAGGQALVGLTLLQCKTWGKYLEQVGNIMVDATKLCEYLLNYVGIDTTIGSAWSFMSAKANLDKALSAFAPLPECSFAKGWDNYITYAADAIKAALYLVSHLQPIGQAGKCAQDIINGLKSHQEAESIIKTIYADPDVTKLLEGVLEGVDTQLDAIRETYTWGESVAGEYGLAESSIKSKLLCAEAATNLRVIRELLQNSVKLYRLIQDKLSELKDYGSFNWDKWHENVLEGNKDFAETIQKRLEIANEQVEAVLPWSKYLAERTDCKKRGLEDCISYLEQRKIPPSVLGAVFEFVVYRSIGRSIYKSMPELSKFTGTAHNKTRNDFATLDKEIISLNGQSFAYEIDKAKKIPSGQTGIRASDRTEMQLLLRELAKKRRHLSIRQLIIRAGRAIQEFKPCFMMGPLSVAQYIEQGSVQFDLVVMDEASQLRPEEALGAIARGKQLVVVGDPKQLPPTNFFDRIFDGGDEDDEDETPAVLSGSESILDICQELFHPARTLRWHYRSQHESLIAFSNHHFYNNKLVVFPSPFESHSSLGLRYRYIRKGSYRDRQNVPEAQRVVGAVVEHMIKHSQDSLGVVTLNQTQRDLIEDILDKKFRNVNETQEFLSSWEENGWPFFVKNLENVQGDERDVIFISTTFGKAPGTDKVRQNFGPISRPDGWRRLNVLFTRARRRIELFTSMLPEDIVVEANTPAGTRALHDYLDYAKRRVLVTTGPSFREPDSDFEIAVGDMLRSKGYDIVPQLGVAGFFIDIAVRNPDKPGEFLAAIECDGAGYHSSKSARDRDRIREEILESLGWKDRIWRIWSTDWFYNPRREADRLLAFLQHRCEVSLSEPTPDYEEFLEEEEYDVEQEVVKAEFESVTEETEPVDSDVFVEVGDYVTYCFADTINEKHSVMIVDSASNPKQNIINEHTALAQALLGLSTGEENLLNLPGGKSKTVLVVKIQRQEKMRI